MFEEFWVRFPAEVDSMAEWLRRLPAKQLGYARASSNLAAVASCRIFKKVLKRFK